MKRKLRDKYAGPLSVAFWKRVNAIKDRQEQLEVYKLGCLLQNAEHRALARLHEAERRTK